MSLVLTPGSATISQLQEIWTNSLSVTLDPSARPAIEKAAELVAKCAAGTEAVYGVNTGFGKLASMKIQPEDTAQLQRNLVLSHCCGVGEPLEISTTRLMVVLKLLSLGRGASGVSVETILMIEKMLEKGVLLGDQKLKSLTAAATYITGTKQSGPLFFGLKQRNHLGGLKLREARSG